MAQQKYWGILELPRLLEQLADCAGCDDSRALARAVTPYSELPRARRALEETVAAYTLSTRYGYPAVYQMKNCAAALARAEKGGILTLRELLDVSLVLRSMRSLDSWRRQTEGVGALEGRFDCLFLDRTLENRLNGAIVSEEELDDNASPALSELRRKIRTAGLRVRSQLDGMIRSAAYQKYLQEPIVTMRDGRFVVPVKAEYKNDVKGMVHDTSSSGATYFIEPMTVVELNNEIRVLQSKEKLEIERIIAELSALVGDAAGQISAGYSAAVELDLCFAKSRLADKMRATVPVLTDSGETTLRRARHPMLDPARAVPIDIAVGKDYDTLVITGPNTGGKTVAIKTLGLLSLMAACGLMIPASDGSVVTVYARVLADIGDEQSIEQSLSTFSAHMTNIIDIVEQSDSGTLVLLDELGAGTDPVEGAALAISIIESLRGRGARVAATTHYSELKLYALDTDGVENASCEFDVQSLRPTYRLLTGIPGRSNAFLISERLGLPQEIIEQAKTLVSADNTRFEDVVTELDAARQSLERERQQAQAMRQQAQAMRAESETALQRLQKDTENELERARVQARRIIEETRVHAEVLFEQLEAIKKEKDAERFSALLAGARQDYRSSMKELEQLSDPVRESGAEQGYTLPRPLKKGDIVYLRTLGKEGIVLKTPEGGSVLVQAGILKTSVPIADVMLGEAPKAPKRENKRGGTAKASGVTSRASRQVKTELDLRGQDAEQAIMELNAFLDTAILSGLNSVCIIHGKGTGVLRAAVAQRLKSHRSVESFRLGRYGEGEDGVTIVQLK